MAHQFTEPTPTGLRGRVHVEVFVSSWEIECCAPTPVVGEPTSWALAFVTPSGSWQLEKLDRERAWRVERRDRSTWLLDGAVAAQWSTHNGSPPEPGRVLLRGSLVGSVHDDAPKVAGTVHRIRFATRTYRLAAPRTLQPVPGTLTLTDVAQAPRTLFFDFDSEAGPLTEGSDQRLSVGVLLDLTVP